MNELQIIFSFISLAIFCSIFYILSAKERSYETNSFKILLIGGVGWFVAFFLRIFPLTLLQVFSLMLLGVNISDSDSVIKMAQHPLVLIWGPILAALFEEGIRYYVIRRYTLVRSFIFRSLIIFGLGWGISEILIIYVPNMIAALFFQQDILWIFLIAGIFERMVAVSFHVLMAILVYFAIYEQWSKKWSLYLAMCFHFLLDALIIVWKIFLNNIDMAAYVWSLEISLAILTAIFYIFITKYWKIRYNNKIGNSV